MAPLPAFALAFGAALTCTSAAAAQRAFVASYGSDANAATNCVATAPCRSFAAAVAVTDPGGEVLALDSIGYGTVVIDRSITLTAAPGAHAGISVAAGGTGVSIATAGVEVTLRGLRINGGVGGAIGVHMSNGSRLSVENCVIANFQASGGSGVRVNTTAKVRIVDSVLRDNYYGVRLQEGPTADIAGTKILGSSADGIFVWAGTASTTTTAAVTDSVVSGGVTGIFSFSDHPTGNARVSVIRSMTTNNIGAGLAAQSDAGGFVVLTVSDSMATGNFYGMFQNGAGAVLETLGNNTVRGNDTDAVGTLTPVPPM